MSLSGPGTRLSKAITEVEGGGISFFAALKIRDDFCRAPQGWVHARPRKKECRSPVPIGIDYRANDSQLEYTTALELN